jgi:phage/plasmid-like protein (TIGR03299 family)
MPHDIATTNGKPSLAYFGEVPWHGLGTKLDDPATAQEAIEAAGLDYQAELKSLWTVDGEPVTCRQAVVRSDNGQVLGVVGKSYQPIQNRQCFGFLDAVVADGRLRYHTAGALGQGERIWMLAKVPGEIRVKDSDDVTEKYLLLSNSHDGSSALRVYFTAIRVVCANTLGLAERRGRGQGVSIAHKGDLAAKVSAAQEILGFAKRFYDDLEGRINQLASFHPTRKQVADYFAELYPDREGSRTGRAQNIRATLNRLFEEGRGQDIPDVRYSAWAAFNAVTEFVDHHRSSRGDTPVDRASRRLQSAWFGSGARIKDRAWNRVVELANGG